MNLHLLGLRTWAATRGDLWTGKTKQRWAHEIQSSLRVKYETVRCNWVRICFKNWRLFRMFILAQEPQTENCIKHRQMNSFKWMKGATLWTRVYLSLSLSGVISKNYIKMWTCTYTGFPWWDWTEGRNLAKLETWWHTSHRSASLTLGNTGLADSRYHCLLPPRSVHLQNMKCTRNSQFSRVQELRRIL